MTTSDSQGDKLGLDRHHLHNVRSAYLKLNKARLELAKDALSELQQSFLDILPSLFHYNHPMLPGYISRATPAGLYGYQLSDELLVKLRQLARSFQPNRDKHEPPEILSLFTMGSFGTIAQNSKSDIDIWLCYRPDLDPETLLYLEKKCKNISLWAQRLNLDVTIFLMNHETFHSHKQRDFNHDASGSTQHYLLLDEFYRSAIHLGGQLPAWIFIVLEQEKNYQACIDNLQYQRLLPDEKIIDFGTIPKIPADEFISSAIWQLYKSIVSPYKSVLKLLLLEIYCQNFNKPKLLSSIFKEQLHGVNRYRIIHHWDVDPYLQTYYFIEEYLLSTNQHQRLEFLRRCFYFKLELPLSNHGDMTTRSSMLLEMTRVWGWDENYILHLDNHERWSLKDVLEERRLIINELNHSYHLVMDFFREQKITINASNRELNVLGRKLHAAFARKAGKIEWVNPLSSKNISEAILIIKKEHSVDSWSASNANGDVIIKKSTPVELITWLHCNQVMISASRLYFSDTESDKKIDSRLLHSLRRLITSLIPLPIKLASHEVFEKSAHLNQILLFIDYRPDRNDVNYSEDNVDITKLECTVDILSVNSWNEIICDTKQGNLFDSLLGIYMRAIQYDQVLLKTDVLCNHPDRHFQLKIRQTFDQLLSGILYFFKDNPSGRYVSKINGRYLVVQLHEQRSIVKWITSEESLKSLLTSSSSFFSPVGFDDKTMSQHPLAVFAQPQKPESIHVFFKRRGNEADITLVDELGTWHESNLAYSSDHYSLKALHRFLRAVNERRNDQMKNDIGPFDIFPIHFFEVIHGLEGLYLSRAEISSQVDSQSGLPIYAVVESINDQYRFTLYVNETRFAEEDTSGKVYDELADFVIKQNDNLATHHPYYISDLDLSKCAAQLSFTGELHTSNYLMMKAYLEEKINRALKNKIN